MKSQLNFWQILKHWDAAIAALALCGMVVIPVLEVLIRPIQGSGIENAPVLVQHLGLIFSLAGAVYAERTGHLTSIGSLWRDVQKPILQKLAALIETELKKGQSSAALEPELFELMDEMKKVKQAARVYLPN